MMPVLQGSIHFETVSKIGVWISLCVICACLLLKDEVEVTEWQFAMSGAEASIDQEQASGQTAEPKFERNLVEPAGGPPAVHSGTLTQLMDGRLLAAWFGGTREGAGDVKIYLARKELDSSHWSTPVVIASREETSGDLKRHIDKLGNPILFADSRGRVWLFYVTVSFGGWSGSSITLRHSDDDGATWSVARRLVTSPFLNVSTLVKGSPVECEGGQLVLPVYHEFLRKFAEALILDCEGNLVSKVRLTADQRMIQPWLVPLDSKRSRAFYRQSGHPDRMVLTNCVPSVFDADCGALESTCLPNSNSAISVVRRPNGEFLMACNPLDRGRDVLSLATSRDGGNWTVIQEIDRSDPTGQVSYPYLIHGPPGEYHLIYTWMRQKMRYACFNEQWLETGL